MINSVDRQLGVLLRQTQWLIDEAAHDIPAGRYHPGKRDELAIVLEHVASLIRSSAPKPPLWISAGREGLGRPRHQP